MLNLAKVKHSVKLRRYMLLGDVAACHTAARVLCAELRDMLPHHQITYNDVILPSV